MLRPIRRSIKRWITRKTLYHNPRAYWERRGKVYRGQEHELNKENAVLDLQSRFLVERVSGLNPDSILEVGCGYGRLLRRFHERLEVPVVGADFSTTQLDEARRYLAGFPALLVLAEAGRLPFRDRSFEVVLTSGVLMHVYPKHLPNVIEELLRIAKRWLVHNEDRIIRAHCFGHDLEKVYRKLGHAASECVPTPYALEKQNLQFLIVDLKRQGRAESLSPAPGEVGTGPGR